VCDGEEVCIYMCGEVQVCECVCVMERKRFGKKIRQENKIRSESLDAHTLFHHLNDLRNFLFECFHALRDLCHSSSVLLSRLWPIFHGFFILSLSCGWFLEEIS